jgi:prepilin-type N-terminal cleavage/methylation domain-containing protein
VRLTRQPAGEAGFTLIELLVAVAVLAVVAVPLGNVVIGFYRNTGATADRLALSHDAQISAAWFARDAATVGRRDYAAPPDPSGNLPYLPSVQLSAGYNAGGQTCGTAALPAARVRLLADGWDLSGASPVLSTDIVAYYLAPVGTVSELHRLKCHGGSVVPVADLVVAHYVDPATLTVTCSSACEAASPPQRITLSFTVTLASVGPYPITLDGQRRQT